MSNSPSCHNVCEAESAIRFDASSLCQDATPSKASPIDDFYSYTGSILANQTGMTASPSLGQVLLLGLVSGSETYFRTIIAGVLRACPLAQKGSSQQMVSLASVKYYGPENIGMGLLENVSFASAGELAKYTDKLLGVKWRENSSIDIAVKQFELLSHLRHAAVHARGDLSARNLHALGVDVTKPRRLALDCKALNDAAHVCTNAVRAYNRSIYAETLKKWLNNGVLVGDWAKDKRKFGPFFCLFRSRTDGKSPRSSYNAFLTIRRTAQKAIAARSGAASP